MSPMMSTPKKEAAKRYLRPLRTVTVDRQFDGPMVTIKGVEYLAELVKWSAYGGSYTYRLTPRSDFDFEPLGAPPAWNFVEVYPAEGPDFDIRFDGVNLESGPMSISHWGMIDLGRFGVVYMPDGAHWQEDGKTFAVVA